jgi:hypothetical protein
MEKTTDSYALASLGSALGSLRERLTGEQAVAFARQIVAAMETTTDSDAVDFLSVTLGAVAAAMEAEGASSVLKSIVCVGNTRQKVLAGMEKQAGREFDGNLWKAVTWLEEQGVDVSRTPALASRNVVP